MFGINNRTLSVLSLLILMSICFICSSVAEPVRIMPLGDSITGSPGCWRKLLWQQLMANGYTNIDFVGSLSGNDCGTDYDGENEGHGGFLATGIVENNQLPAWLDSANPDIVMLFLGTNDTWGGGKGTPVILDAFATLVGQMRANNPRMKIIVAQIPPNGYPGCTQCTPNIRDLNAAIPGWAAALYTEESPISVVDLFTGFDPETDTYDGCHPNDVGNVKLADSWFPALARILDGDIPTPGPTSVPTPSPTPIVCAGVPEWKEGTVYPDTGMRVLYNGILYENNWYSLNQNPEQNSGANQVWTRIGPCNPDTTPQPTPTPGNNLGDVNSDGEINIIDALMVAQYTVGLNPPNFQVPAADVNCDGMINIVDALIIAQYGVGLVTVFC